MAPPGYGPPGGGAPGYGPPGGGAPGYGPAQPGYAPQPAKKSKTLLWLGIGCGGLLLLSLAGGIAGYFFLRGQVDDAESAIKAAASAAAVGAPTTPAVKAGGTCGKAQACCEAIAKKNANGQLAKQACAAYGTLGDSVCAQQYAALKQTATALGGSCE